MWGMLANLARCLPAEAAHRVAVATLHHNLGPVSYTHLTLPTTPYV